MSLKGRKQTFKVARGEDGDTNLEEYEITLDEGMVVLDCMHRIQHEQEPDMAVRWNCKAGKCGSCSAEINGRPRLMCMTRMSDVVAETPEGKPIEIRPMKTFLTSKTSSLMFHGTMMLLNVLLLSMVQKPWIGNSTRWKLTECSTSVSALSVSSVSTRVTFYVIMRCSMGLQVLETSSVLHSMKCIPSIPRIAFLKSRRNSESNTATLHAAVQKSVLQESKSPMMPSSN